MHHGPGTHCAGLKRNVHSGARQSIVGKCSCGFPERLDFRVSCRIVVPDGLIKATTKDFTINDNDRTHWNLTRCFSLLRQQQSLAHKLLIVLSHGFDSAAASKPCPIPTR
jgi:hypothetical protein